MARATVSKIAAKDKFRAKKVAEPLRNPKKIVNKQNSRKKDKKAEKSPINKRYPSDNDQILTPRIEKNE